MKQVTYRRIKRGDFVYVDFGNIPGSAIAGTRPAVVVQNDTGNWHSSTIIVSAIATGSRNPRHPTHVEIGGRFGLHKESVLYLEQLATVDKSQVGTFIGHANDDLLEKIDRALAASIGLQLSKKKRKPHQNHTGSHNTPAQQKVAT